MHYYMAALVQYTSTILSTVV